MIHTLLSSYRSVIALNSKEIQTIPIRSGVPVIAADGAACWIKADYVVGDGDSFKGRNLILMPDQNQTDFEKCITFATKNRYLPALIIGMNGGEIDHVFGNMQVFLKYVNKGSLFFLDGSAGQFKIGIGLEKGTFRTQIRPEATVSLFSFGLCELTTEGLVWELTNERLVPNGLLALRNRAKGNSMTFHVSKGKALAVLDV